MKPPAPAGGAWTRASIERRLVELVREAPENRLDRDGADHVFDAPLAGVADGDDPVFARFREVVSPRHRMPRDWLGAAPAPAAVRVVCWILPFSAAVRASNRQPDWPSALYSLARNNGAALDVAVSRRLAAELVAAGWRAAVPVVSDGYDVFRSDDRVFASTWSQRHIAYAAGLGRFGLNHALITARGIYVRIGSLVTDAPLDVGPARPPDTRAPCLATAGRACDRCRPRCPVDAISGAGLDKVRCYDMRQAVRRRSLDTYIRELPLLPIPVTKSGRTVHSHSLGCALCQCGVPCESSDPFAAAGPPCST